jgi:hypothetical protein
MLWSWGRTPRLLLPAALLDRIDGQQRATLLVHELAHLRRRDHWVRCLELLVTGLYWWHPVVWWARREIEVAEEECCDAWVVWALPAAARSYATALMETVDFLSEIRPALPPAVSGMGHVSLLRRRLTMIMYARTPRALTGAGRLVLVGLAVLLLPWIPTWAQQVPSPQERTVAELLLQASAEPAAAVPQAAAQRALDNISPAERLEAAKDEVELLEAQLDVKRSQLAEAEAKLGQAKRRLETRAALRKQNALSAEELDQARGEVEVLMSQLRTKRAELREPEIRLKQAKQRLARLQQPPRSATQRAVEFLHAQSVAEQLRNKALAETRTAENAPNPVGGAAARPADRVKLLEDRVYELENTVKDLYRQVDILRKEVKKPQALLYPTPASGPALTVPYRNENKPPQDPRNTPTVPLAPGPSLTGK